MRHLKPDERSRLRISIVSIRHDAQERLTAHRRTIVEQCGDRRAVGDVTDEMQSEEATGTAAALCDAAVQTMHRADEALRAITNGTYGICASCGAGIPLQRLQALPFTRLCIVCAEDAELRSKEQRRSALSDASDLSAPDAP